MRTTRRLAAGLLTAMALGCGDGTGPEPQAWYVGEWNVFSVDGLPVPATFIDAGVRRRFEQMLLRMGVSFTEFGYEFATLQPDGTETARSSCNRFTDRTVVADTVTLQWNATAMGTCPQQEIAGRRFVRVGNEMVTTFMGHEFRLRR